MTVNDNLQPKMLINIYQRRQFTCLHRKSANFRCKSTEQFSVSRDRKKAWLGFAENFIRNEFHISQNNGSFLKS